MRQHKQGDSPSGYDRDVHHMAAGHRVTVTTIQHDFATALTHLNDQRVRLGGRVPALQPVDEILALIEGLARVGRLEALQSTLDSIGALAVAARLAHARGEVVDVTSGDAA